PNGAGVLVEALRNLRYEVRGLVWGPPPAGKAAGGDGPAYSQKALDAPHEVPANAMTLVIAQPQARYPKEVLDALGKYLDNKGKLLFLSNLLVQRTNFSLIETGLEDFLAQHGV